MTGIKDLTELLKNMTPILNKGNYVFVQVDNFNKIDRDLTLFEFKEEEGITIVTSKENADRLGLEYNFIAAWITLSVNSSLEAIGLTARFSSELSKHGISCNVVAAYSHDHIFVAQSDGMKAIQILRDLSKNT